MLIGYDETLEKATRALDQIVTFNNFDLITAMRVFNFFEGFELKVLKDKVSALNTPFQLSDLNRIH